jgi:ribosomal protein S10
VTASRALPQYAQSLGAKSTMTRMPTSVQRFSVLKSPFKYHKAFDAFQFKTHARLVTMKNLPVQHQGHVANMIDQLPPGLNCKVTSWMPLTVPFPKSLEADKAMEGYTAP